jgi:hypothetical protein
MPKPENIIDKGFDKNPQNINRKGRPPKLIKHVNNELIAQGFKVPSREEIVEGMLLILQMSYEEVKNLADPKIPTDYPFFYKLIAKEVVGKMGGQALEKLLDRAFGKATQETKTELDINQPLNFIIQEVKRKDDEQ